MEHKKTIDNKGCSLTPFSNTMQKKSYDRLSMIPVASIPKYSILASSIINNAKIVSIGQELGPAYDLSDGIDDNTGKTFSHEWNQGN